MNDSARFPFNAASSGGSSAILLPYLPLRLSHGATSLSVAALVDSGSAVNVLAYEVGIRLGLRWEEQGIPVALTGNLATIPAKGIILTAQVASFAPVELAFAWTQAAEVPTLLGQVNFFEEFDVCLFRSQAYIEVRPKA